MSAGGCRRQKVRQVVATAEVSRQHGFGASRLAYYARPPPLGRSPHVRWRRATQSHLGPRASCPGNGSRGNIWRRLTVTPGKSWTGNIFSPPASCTEASQTHATLCCACTTSASTPSRGCFGNPSMRRSNCDRCLGRIQRGGVVCRPAGADPAH